LPEEVTLSAEGVLSGTPAESGTFGFTVRVTDGALATAEQSLRLVVSPETLVVVTASLPSAKVGVAYTAQLAGAGGVPPYSWGLATNSAPLPNGLSLAPHGALSGVAESADEVTLVLVLQDAPGSSAEITLQLSIAAVEARMYVEPQTAQSIETQGFRLGFATDTPGTYSVDFSQDFLVWSNLVLVEMEAGSTNVVDRGAIGELWRVYRVGRLR
jgi:hypothetical protein